MNFSAEMNVCSSAVVHGSAVLHTRPHWDNHMLWLCFSLSSSSPTLLPWSHAVLLIYLLIQSSSALQRLLLSCSLWSWAPVSRVCRNQSIIFMGPAQPPRGSWWQTGKHLQEDLSTRQKRAPSFPTCPWAIWPPVDSPALTSAGRLSACWIRARLCAVVAGALGRGVRSPAGQQLQRSVQ